VETVSIVVSLDIANSIAQALPLESLPMPLLSLVASAPQVQAVLASTVARLATARQIAHLLQLADLVLQWSASS
jgi:hypothetical protein